MLDERLLTPCRFPYRARNFVSHSLADQTSMTRFIRDNWQLGQMGPQSFDALAGPILNMFDFNFANDRNRNLDRQLILDPSSGEPVSPSR
jgi:phospholipase C